MAFTFSVFPILIYAFISYYENYSYLSHIAFYLFLSMYLSIYIYFIKGFSTLKCFLKPFFCGSTGVNVSVGSDICKVKAAYI